MKHLLSIVLFTLSYNSILAQHEMERGCIERLKKSLSGFQLPRSNDSVIVRGDTLRFERTQVILLNSCPEAVLIFKKNLLTPTLIMGASTNGDGQIKISTIPALGSVTINSFREFKLAGQSPTLKTFSFLIWSQGIMNPNLYVLELRNSRANEFTNNFEFIQGAETSVFGFCSILL
jgi:hypothetical protein